MVLHYLIMGGTLCPTFFEINKTGIYKLCSLDINIRVSLLVSKEIKMKHYISWFIIRQKEKANVFINH